MGNIVFHRRNESPCGGRCSQERLVEVPVVSCHDADACNTGIRIEMITKNLNAIHGEKCWVPLDMNHATAAGLERWVSH